MGWDQVATLAQEDGLAGFASVREEETVTAIRQHLGPQWRTDSWQVYLGPPEQVLPACDSLIVDVELPNGWRIDSLSQPSDAQIATVQALNAETGVSPYPPYYSRGEAVPVLTLCISDDDGALAATASAAYRYHPEGRLAGNLFAGMVSVAPTRRRLGLGRLVNALMLQESYGAFGWTVAKEQVATDNAPSQTMIAACGLDDSAGLVSIAATNSEDSFTR